MIRPVVSLLVAAASVLPPLGLAGCGSTGPNSVGTLRFVNQAPAWRVNDRKDVAEKPKEHPFPEFLYFFDTLFYRRTVRGLEMANPVRAQNVNSLGEVPDSTWFTNRVGKREVSLDEIRRGPNRDDGPDRSKKWTVVSGKTGGGSKGFVLKDARGDRYILKFDEVQSPTMESATDVAVLKILWALGYNVPENHVVYFRRGDIVLAEDASVKDLFGNKRSMTETDLELTMNNVYRHPDGRYRALVSKYLPGIPIGGFPQSGVREDDPNDLVPHEHRREIRGLYVFFSWLQQTDVKEDNTLDLWREDPADPSRHYVEHYLLDFGKSFGTSAFITKRPDDGHVYNLDFENTLKSLLSFGLRKRPWEGTAMPGYTGVGMFDAEHYDPGTWRSHTSYEPFSYRDVHDMFWAAKILAELTREQIQAALEQGQFEDERAVPYLTEVLLERQKKTIRYWFQQTNPLDRFEVNQEANAVELCFSDLLLHYELAPDQAAATRYRARSYDYAGGGLNYDTELAPDARGNACTGTIPTGTAEDGYTIVRIDSRRGDETLAPVEVHLARDSADRYRVIGVRRW